MIGERVVTLRGVSGVLHQVLVDAEGKMVIKGDDDLELLRNLVVALDLGLKVKREENHPEWLREALERLGLYE